MGHKKDGPVYRYPAIREPLAQQALPGMEEQLSLSFQTMAWDALTYKVTGVVTNREIPGDELIWWYRKRCGKSEEAYSILKEDLPGAETYTFRTDVAHDPISRSRVCQAALHLAHGRPTQVPRRS